MLNSDQLTAKGIIGNTTLWAMKNIALVFSLTVIVQKDGLTGSGHVLRIFTTGFFKFSFSIFL
jgi:hypothetical protein